MPGNQDRLSIAKRLRTTQLGGERSPLLTTVAAMLEADDRHIRELQGKITRQRQDLAAKDEQNRHLRIDKAGLLADVRRLTAERDAVAARLEKALVIGAENRSALDAAVQEARKVEKGA